MFCEDVNEALDAIEACMSTILVLMLDPVSLYGHVLYCMDCIAYYIHLCFQARMLDESLLAPHPRL